MSSKKRRVLQEDDYLACMSYLLRRDFYPTLDPHDPVSLGDDDQYAASRRSTKRPSTFRSPSDIVARYRLDRFASVDAFQSVYTSEDNASFEEILNRMNEEKRKRWRHFFNTDRPLLTAGNVPKYLLSSGNDAQTEERLLLWSDKPGSEVHRTGTINFAALHAFSGKTRTRSSSTPTPGFETPSSATSLSSWSRGTPRRPSDHLTPALRHILQNATPSRDPSDRVDLSGVFNNRTPRRSSKGTATFKTPKQPKNK